MIWDWIDKLPEYVGTIPQWGMFLVLCGGLWRLVLSTRAQAFTHVDKVAEHYRNEVKVLRDEVSDLTNALRICERNCAEETQSLKDALLGEKSNRIQEQLSLINVILGTVESPELRAMMHTLESVQIAIRSQQREGASDVQGA